MIFQNKLHCSGFQDTCGVAGNELTDYLEKQGASMLQTSRNAIPCNNIKLLIKTKNFNLKIFREELTRPGGITSRIFQSGLGARLFPSSTCKLDTIVFFNFFIELNQPKNLYIGSPSCGRRWMQTICLCDCSWHAWDILSALQTFL